MTRILASVLSAVLVAVAAAPSPAAERGVEVVEPNGDGVAIPAGGGRLLRLSRPATTVFVANPEIADIHVKSPSLVYITAKSAGFTTVFAVDDKEVVIANIDIRVTPNIARLQQAITDLHPDLAITARAVAGSVVLSGTVPTSSDAEDLRVLAEKIAGSRNAVVNRLQVVAPMQINLRVRVAEMSREIQKQIGFNWNVGDTFRSATLGGVFANPFTNAATATQTVTASGKVRGVSLNAVVDLLEEEGLVKILAEPNLTAMSGETASFLAGGEFPILVPDSNGRVTIEFKKFGVSLAFTPTILGEDRINLHVRPEVSQLSNANAVILNNFTVPSLTTRRAETTVELASGQSFAVAGLLRNDITHDVSRVPGLTDIPILGALFRSDNFQRNESELVILVTPYIVQPVSASQLAMPTDGYRAPSDADRILRSQMHRPEIKQPPRKTVGMGGRPIIGPVGFDFN